MAHRASLGSGWTTCAAGSALKGVVDVVTPRGKNHDPATSSWGSAGAALLGVVGGELRHGSLGAVVAKALGQDGQGGDVEHVLGQSLGVVAGHCVTSALE